MTPANSPKARPATEPVDIGAAAPEVVAEAADAPAEPVGEPPLPPVEPVSMKT